MSNGYYISINSWAVYVKEAEFFKSQGGKTEEWGKGWIYVEAEGIEHARLIGKVKAWQQGLTRTITGFPW
jgi:hypothetical protein